MERQRDRDYSPSKRRHNSNDYDEKNRRRRCERSNRRSRTRSPGRVHRRSRTRSPHRSHRRSRSRSHRRNRRSRSRSARKHHKSRSKSPKRSHRRSKDEDHSKEPCEKDRTPPPPPALSALEPTLNIETETQILEPESSKSEIIAQFEKKNRKPGAYVNLNPDEPIDKEKIHKEIEEKLRDALAREGINYNAPKSEPEASHPIFANDGSFLEIFKKMQETEVHPKPVVAIPSLSSNIMPTTATSSRPLPPQLPVFGRRRGGKILKTGVVAKPKNPDDGGTDPKDFWAIYLREVNKYKNAACESDGQSRPLVK